jgi:hypothetical protein
MRPLAALLALLALAAPASAREMVCVEAGSCEAHVLAVSTDGTATGLIAVGGAGANGRMDYEGEGFPDLGLHLTGVAVCEQGSARGRGAACVRGSADGDTVGASAFGATRSNDTAVSAFGNAESWRRSVSVFGDAGGDGDAVSVFGNAGRCANQFGYCEYWDQAGLAATVFGNAYGYNAVSVFGEARCTGNGCIAVSVLGAARCYPDGGSCTAAP